jgi:hypothetical protein
MSPRMRGCCSLKGALLLFVVAFKRSDAAHHSSISVAAADVASYLLIIRVYLVYQIMFQSIQLIYQKITNSILHVKNHCTVSNAASFTPRNQRHQLLRLGINKVCQSGGGHAGSGWGGRPLRRESARPVGPARPPCQLAGCLPGGRAHWADRARWARPLASLPALGQAASTCRLQGLSFLTKIFTGDIFWQYVGLGGFFCQKFLTRCAWCNNLALVPCKWKPTPITTSNRLYSTLLLLEKVIGELV